MDDITSILSNTAYSPIIFALVDEDLSANAIHKKIVIKWDTIVLRQIKEKLLPSGLVCISKDKKRAYSLNWSKLLNEYQQFALYGRKYKSNVEISDSVSNLCKALAVDSFLTDNHEKIKFFESKLKIKAYDDSLLTLNLANNKVIKGYLTIFFLEALDLVKKGHILSVNDVFVYFNSFIKEFIFLKPDLLKSLNKIKDFRELLILALNAFFDSLYDEKHLFKNAILSIKAQVFQDLENIKSSKK